MDQILNNPGPISQVEIVKQLAILERDIIQDVRNGSKEYFKPERIKAMSAYDNPLRESGIKASIVFNELKDESEEPIDLSTRNTVLNIKIDLNKNNVDGLKEKYPTVYQHACQLLERKEFSKGITGIAILEHKNVPEWVRDYIDYVTIVNDNLHNFPCEAVGIDRREKDPINYTNLIRL